MHTHIHTLHTYAYTYTCAYNPHIDTSIHTHINTLHIHTLHTYAYTCKYAYITHIDTYKNSYITHYIHAYTYTYAYIAHIDTSIHTHIHTYILCIHICILTHIDMSIHTHIHTYICIHICIRYTHRYVDTYTRTYIYTYAYIYAYVTHIDMSIHTHIHTYIHAFIPSNHAKLPVWMGDGTHVAEACHTYGEAVLLWRKEVSYFLFFYLLFFWTMVLFWSESHMWLRRVISHIWRSLSLLPGGSNHERCMQCDSFECDMTRSHVTWLIHIQHDTFTFFELIHLCWWPREMHEFSGWNRKGACM